MFKSDQLSNLRNNLNYSPDQNAINAIDNNRRRNKTNNLKNIMSSNDNDDDDDDDDDNDNNNNNRNKEDFSNQNQKYFSTSSSSLFNTPFQNISSQGSSSESNTSQSNSIFNQNRTTDFSNFNSNSTFLLPPISNNEESNVFDEYNLNNDIDIDLHNPNNPNNPINFNPNNPNYSILQPPSLNDFSSGSSFSSSPFSSNYNNYPPSSSSSSSSIPPSFNYPSSSSSSSSSSFNPPFSNYPSSFSSSNSPPNYPPLFSSSSNPPPPPKLDFNFGNYNIHDPNKDKPIFSNLNEDWGPIEAFTPVKKNVNSTFKPGPLHIFNPYSHQQPNKQFDDISKFNQLKSHFKPGKSRILSSKEERDEIVKNEKQKIFNKWQNTPINTPQLYEQFGEEWARADRMGRFEENYDPVGWHELGNLVANRQHDIKWNRNLVAFEQAERWLLKQKELESFKPTNKRKWDGYQVIAADYDLDPETPDNVILLDKDGKIRAIDGYQLASSSKKKKYQTLNELIPRKDDQKYLFEKLQPLEIALFRKWIGTNKTVKNQFNWDWIDWGKAYILEHPKFLIKTPSKAIKDYLKNKLFDPKVLEQNNSIKNGGWYEKKYYRSVFGRTWGMVNEYCKKNLIMPPDEQIKDIFLKCYDYIKNTDKNFDFQPQPLPIPTHRLEYRNKNESFFLKKNN
jgi:hypothetical protein